MVGKRPILEVIDDLQADGYLGALELEDKVDYYSACCPFHEEKNPSFAIYLNADDDASRWICFGCGKSGDTIDLVMEVCDVGYTDAVKFACEYTSEHELTARLLANSVSEKKIDVTVELEKSQKTIKKLLKSKRFEEAFEILKVVQVNFSSTSVNAKLNIKRAINDIR